MMWRMFVCVCELFVTGFLNAMIPAATSTAAAEIGCERVKYVKAIILIAIPPSARCTDPILALLPFCLMHPSLHFLLHKTGSTRLI